MDDAEKNALCRPIFHPDTDLDFLRTTIADAFNERVWRSAPARRAWLDRSRLNSVRDLEPALPAEGEARRQALEMRVAVTEAMSAKMERLLAAA